MKTIEDLKRDIAHLPDDTQICEDCNYELLDKLDDDENADEGELYCPNEMCLNGA